ncbi:hypothetical protein [Nocardia goodfellowii]|uniref:Toprim domain-containing protein n=1 Tax=Nocardia goodfellowii TaxID=882446 RepID=A0ABS4QTW5_9NOCA|nr:hypothetical protein [Nocardia goodfellowii]MBP2194543.1 hypothetical protein [Nocardia goodfellowii]
MSAPASQSRARTRGRAGAREEDRSPRSWARVTAALEEAVGPGQRAGEWTKYCCPVHENDGRDHSPSLIAKYLADVGRTKVECRAGCDDRQVLAQLGLGVGDLYDKPSRGRGRRQRSTAPARELSRADRAIEALDLPPKNAKKSLGERVSVWRTVDTYTYCDADGDVVGEVVRREARFERGRGKTFTQRAWDPRESRWHDTGFAKVPYRLPEVRAAIEAGLPVYVVEGEKDVESGRRAGLIATTNAGGGLGWTDEHSQYLRGAKLLVIVTDRDATGMRRADRIRTSTEGLVDRVRVVCAATGKDLTDHLAAGHEVADMAPIPHLDPYAPISTPESVVPQSLSPGPGGPAVSSGGPLMADATTIHHDDSVDHVSSAWAAFMKLLLQYMLAAVARDVAARRAAAEAAANQDAADKARAAAELAAERTAAETRIRKLREDGLDKASRSEIAQAVAEAAAWAPESDIAAGALIELKAVVYQRFSIEIDAFTGQVVTAGADSSPELAATLRDRAVDEASAARVRDAQRRMIELVAREEIDQSTREALYAEIEHWRTNPTPAGLTNLSKKLADKGLKEQTVTRIRFIGAYLGIPGQEISDDEVGTVSPVRATKELRKLSECLVDPAEEAKPGIDRLFESYQDRLKSGNPQLISSVRARLDAALKILTPEDQAKAKARGNDIRKHPTKTFAPLWPDHVDRDELATSVRMLAVLAPQADAAAVRANAVDDTTAAGMRKQIARHHKAITRAITEGKGLHELERDQLAAVLRDVEAGKPTTPELLFADDRSAAAVDADRAARMAQISAQTSRRQVEKILDTNAVPSGTLYRTRNDLTRVMDTQTALAAGQASLGDYERTGVDARLRASLSAAGVNRPLRDQVQAQLYTSAGEAASMGKQAHRIAQRWEERRQAVVAARSPQTPAYDSPERGAAFAATLAEAGLDADEIAQRLAAAAGRAKPVAAMGRIPDSARRSAPGAGVQHIHHRRGKGQGRDEDGVGR